MRSDIWHDVHRLHGEGLGTEAIARATGRPAYRVQRLLTESGALNRQYEYGIRDYRLIEAYGEGLTQRDICDQFRVPASVLQKVLKVHGVPPRPRKQPLDPVMVKSAVADYLDSELTREEICAAHGITSGTLDRILTEQDVPKRTPPTTGRKRNGQDFL